MEASDCSEEQPEGAPVQLPALHPVVGAAGVGGQQLELGGRLAAELQHEQDRHAARHHGLDNVGGRPEVPADRLQLIEPELVT